MSEKVNDLPCKNKKLERAYQLKTFHLPDLLNCTHVNEGLRVVVKGIWKYRKVRKFMKEKHSNLTIFQKRKLGKHFPT